MHFVATGRALDPKKVERATVLSVDKYCSAIQMLNKTATVTYDFEVVDSAPAPTPVA
jgi:putative redox protein